VKGFSILPLRQAIISGEPPERLPLFMQALILIAVVIKSLDSKSSGK
jgi:hypothetical protein